MNCILVFTNAKRRLPAHSCRYRRH